MALITNEEHARNVEVATASPQRRRVEQMEALKALLRSWARSFDADTGVQRTNHEEELDALLKDWKK
jgi:hypothetical protein